MEMAERSYGHAHFWDRAAAHGISRGQFLARSAGTVGAAAGFSLLLPTAALAAGSDPKPIPGGIQPAGPGTPMFHLFLPGPGSEPSSITDFNGHVGVAAVRGSGTGTGGAFNFEVDMRFMKGVYSGEDSKLRQGAFAFV